MQRARLRLLTAILISAGTLACGDSLEREYLYTRPEPAPGRTSPVVYVVKLQVDRAARTVVWIEDAHDNEGSLGRSTKNFKNCTFRDDENWECEPLLWPGEKKVMEQVQMRDGRLHQLYYSENRTFTLRRRMFGIPLFF